MTTPRYRAEPPQLNGDLFITDAGLETDLIFNKGIDIPEFASHTLLPDSAGREAMIDYFRGFIELAREKRIGFILDAPTWKAHPHWATALGSTVDELRAANLDAVAFVESLRKEYELQSGPIVLNAVIGPCGDAYAPDTHMSVEDAQEYHATQLSWLAETEVDMVSALTFTQAPEAAGLVNAARLYDLPAVVSFTVETDGALPTGQPLADAIAEVDERTDAYAAYFMVNCAHPDHFFGRLEEASWARRIRGLRCNASRLSHAELDSCETLDDGDPVELASQCASIRRRMPWLNVFGGCCGSDLRHVTQILRALAA